MVNVVISKNGAVVRIYKSWKDLEDFSENPEFFNTKVSRAFAVTSIRRQVYAKDNGECRRCGKFLTWEQAHMDEIVPKGKGGEVSLVNCRILCYDCHLGREDSSHGNRKPKFSKGVKNERL